MPLEIAFLRSFQDPLLLLREQVLVCAELCQKVPIGPPKVVLVLFSENLLNIPVLHGSREPGVFTLYMFLFKFLFTQNWGKLNQNEPNIFLLSFS